MRRLGWAIALGGLGMGALGMVGCQDTTPPAPVYLARPLDAQEERLAQVAWRYLEQQKQHSGLVSSAAAFPAVSMWDVGSQLAGMIAARELGLAAPGAWEAWISSLLESLAKLPLTPQGLPNKVHHAVNLAPLTYGKLTPVPPIGTSAIDMGRLVRWLDVLGAIYPQHRPAVQGIYARWPLSALAKDGRLWGTSRLQGRLQGHPEGRYGYEQLSAYPLARHGLALGASLDLRSERIGMPLEGVEIGVDRRNEAGAHNYLTSEPFVLEGLEGGFRALPAEDAGRMLLAQERRHERTGTYTCRSEDNLDQSPYFTYGCLFANHQAWGVVSADGKPHPQRASRSLKAAVAWHVLFRRPYTELLMGAFPEVKPDQVGLGAGAYEANDAPNKALTLNTNAIVLEALLVAKLGQPIEAWAGLPEVP